ncbi:hypothetical protein ACGFLS_21865 [Streptomyces abikoensis]|uniref:hypothetical protein n=1 Tax=Streptomyces abikoensis TaxID=97398 RepID=UPI003722ABBD
MTVDEAIKEAAARGIKGFPEPSRLTHVRVWPAHVGKWVAEVGEPPHNLTVGELHATREEAREAALAHLEEVRKTFLASLPEDLARLAEPLPELVINEWEQ